MRDPVLVAFVLLAACSKPVPDDSRDLRKMDLADAPSAAMRASDTVSQEAGPNIGVTAAPGVAFNYRYAFRLPNARVAAVQEQHAAMCEKLGVTRCRITGLRYRLTGDKDVEAMLALKLAPDIARAFGKDAIATVGKAEGMLIDSEIGGEDAGADIVAAERERGRLRDELARIEAQLAKSGLSASERAELTAQARSLRDQLRSTTATKSEAREKLASTPMVLQYGSGDVIPGFDGTSPLRDAFRQGWLSFVTMLSFIIIAFGVLLPWAVAGGIAWAVMRAVRRRWPRRTDEAI